MNSPSDSRQYNRTLPSPQRAIPPNAAKAPQLPPKAVPALPPKGPTSTPPALPPKGPSGNTPPLPPKVPKKTPLLPPKSATQTSAQVGAKVPQKLPGPPAVPTKAPIAAKSPSVPTKFPIPPPREANGAIKALPKPPSVKSSVSSPSLLPSSTETSKNFPPRPTPSPQTLPTAPTHSPSLPPKPSASSHSSNPPPSPQALRLPISKETTDPTVPKGGAASRSSGNFFSSNRKSLFIAPKVPSFASRASLAFAKPNRPLSGDSTELLSEENDSRELSPEEKKEEMNASIRRSKESGQLDLSGRELTEMPPGVETSAPFILNFNLSFNLFTSLSSMKAFSQLEILDLAGNQLVAVGGVLEGLLSLRELKLNGNKISSMDFIANVPKLEILHVQNNNISVVPPSIKLLNKLEELNLSGNPIKSFPRELGHCTVLEVLQADGCSLRSLPEELTLLTRLIDLNLGHNALETLPEGLGRLTRLCSLNVSDNMLKDLPMSAGYCIGLGRIGNGFNIERNPFQDQKIVEKYKIGNDHLLDYLEKRLTLAEYYLPPPPSLSENVQSTGKQTESKKNVMSAAQREEITKKVNALAKWGETCAEELKGKVIELRQTIQSLEDAVPLTQHTRILHTLFEEIQKVKALLPKQRTVTISPVNSSDSKLQQVKKLCREYSEDINVTLTTLKKTFGAKTTAEDLDEVVQLVKFLRTFQSLFP